MEGVLLLSKSGLPNLDLTTNTNHFVIALLSTDSKNLASWGALFTHTYMHTHTHVYMHLGLFYKGDVVL